MYQAAKRGRRIPREVQRRMPLGSEYLGEDERYWYYVEPGSPTLGGMFNIGKMFKRMTKFTPSSFKLKNIMGALGSAVAFTATGGIANVAAEIAGPSGLKLTKGTITGAHSSAMKALGYATAAVGAVVGGVMVAPSVMSILGPKLALAGGLLGKAGSSVGGGLFGILGKLIPSKQAEVAQQVTPEDIAYMDQYGQIPSRLAPYLDQVAAQSLPTMNANNGAASLYDPSMSYATGAQAPVEAGFLDNMDGKTMLLLFGLPTAFFLFQMITKKKS
jgi:hypothetical protein